MQRIFYASIAVASLLAAPVTDLRAARRPRYGGVLRLEMRAAVTSLDPAEWPADPAAASAKEKLAGLVFETLVRLDDRGGFQPWLATAWTHDAARRRWIFTPRPNVVLHNGAAWEPGVLSASDDQPIEEILRTFSRPRSAIAVRTADGRLVGSGPFRVARWESGVSATLAVHDSYWGPKPYLDGIEVRMGRSLRDQALDFDLGKSDVVEISVADSRRIRQRGLRLSLTRPVETLALVFDQSRRVAASMRQALALSIDRVAIHNVILQREGEPTGALLPQWLSGYAFLFAPLRDLDRARELAGKPTPLVFSYDRTDPLIRAVADRVAVNAAEAGLTLRAGEPGDLRLARLPINAPDVALALSGLAAALRTPLPEGDLYSAEKSLLDGSSVIPLFHLPAIYQVAARVQDWQPGPGDRLRLEDVWLSGDRP